jgi:hypothetical protein
VANLERSAKMKPFLTPFTLLVALCGCATDGVPSLSAPSGYPINGQSKIQLATYFKYMPSLSGYYLPAGIYAAEKEDANGVFFKAPKGVKSLSLAGATDVDGGGIYLPKQGGKNVRGYAYVILPVFGRRPYLLPDDFFSGYGKNWGILKEPNQQSLEPTAPSGRGVR